MIPTIPRRFENTGGTLDMEAINDDLEALASAIDRNLSKRYTYCTFQFDLDGVTNASAEVLRQLPIRLPSSTTLGIEICQVEVVIYAAGSEVWTLTCSDSSWPAITVTAAGATTEAHAISNMAAAIQSISSDVTFTMSAGAASTITRGYIVVTLRVDRGNNVSNYDGFTPTLLNSATSTAASIINDQMTLADAAVDRDTDSDKDLRCECFTVRNLASGSSVEWLLPSGVRSISQLSTAAYIVGGAGSTATCTVTGTGLTSAIDAAPVATGASNRVFASGATTGTMNDDPMDSADDATVTITISGGVTADLVFFLVWWR